MKPTFLKLVSLGAVLLLSGCAGMPDMKNSPFNASSIAGMIPGGSAARGLIEPGLAAAQSTRRQPGIFRKPKRSALVKKSCPGCWGRRLCTQTTVSSATSIRLAAGLRCIRSVPICPGASPFWILRSQTPVPRLVGKFTSRRAYCSG